MVTEIDEIVKEVEPVETKAKKMQKKSSAPKKRSKEEDDRNFCYEIMIGYAQQGLQGVEG